MSADAVGGVWTYATELRAALAGEGVEVVIATLGPQPPPDAGIRWRRCRLEWQPGGEADIDVTGRWLKDLAAEIGADAIHLNGYGHGALDWDRPTVVVAHSCVSSWHEAVRATPAPSSWNGYRAMAGAGLSRADEVVAPTAAMLHGIRRLYGLSRRGRVIHNAVAPGPPPVADRQPVVLGAGRLWDEAKGLDALEAAAATLAWPVEVAGADDGVRFEHVRLLGPISRARLRERMAQASIFAHPARYEPFGLAVLEAALGGCALVLGDIPSLRELWDGAASFVAPGDPGELADAIEAIASQPAERARLAQHARERAQRYRPQLMARAYAALYERLTAQRRVAA